jgi:hypothetical protein
MRSNCPSNVRLAWLTTGRARFHPAKRCWHPGAPYSKIAFASTSLAVMSPVFASQMRSPRIRRSLNDLARRLRDPR